MTDNELKNEVKTLLLSNVSEGYSKLLDKHYCYIQPSAGTYPFQYWWDTCFHIFILSDLREIELAKRNFQSLFSQQEENGFIGHMIFWKKTLPTKWSDVLQAKPTLHQIRPHMSALIQPPLVAQALKRIYDKSQDKNFVKEMLPKLIKYFTWLEENRDFDRDGLISIITPFESGMDWNPIFDPVVGHYGIADKKLFLKVVSVDFRNFMYRYDLKKIYHENYFIVKDVIFNSAYGLDLYTMYELCSLVKDEHAEHYKARYQKVVKRMMQIMYDEKDKAFYNVYGKDNKKLKVLAPSTFFPLVFADIIPESVARDVFDTHLLSNEEFWTPYPIPSIAQNHPAFDPTESHYIWRGPTWIVFNWFLYRCLLTRNYTKEADKIMQTVIELIKKSGFREYYNPYTGEGYGAKQFTWSGLIVDMMRIRNEYNMEQGK